jgi:integrase
MTLRVEQGKGQRDRYVMLSLRLLELLREWWRAARLEKARTWPPRAGLDPPHRSNPSSIEYTRKRLIIGGIGREETSIVRGEVGFTPYGRADRD